MDHPDSASRVPRRTVLRHAAWTITEFSAQYVPTTDPIWNFSPSNDGGPTKPGSLYVTPLTSLDATSVTVSIGDQVFGPFSVDRSFIQPD